MNHTAADVAVALSRSGLRDVACEYSVQAQIARALTDAGISYEREVGLSREDRIDFLAGSVGIEVKVAGSPSAVVRQLARYANSGRVSELVLIVTRARIATLIPGAINDKPVTVVVGGRRL